MLHIKTVLKAERLIRPEEWHECFIRQGKTWKYLHCIGVTPVSDDSKASKEEWVNY